MESLLVAKGYDSGLSLLQYLGSIPSPGTEIPTNDAAKKRERKRKYHMSLWHIWGQSILAVLGSANPTLYRLKMGEL